MQAAPLSQPSVFDAMPTVSRPQALTRPSGTVLHVERDAEYVMAVRSMRGTCSRDEWAIPSFRRLAIARAWERCVEALAAEDEQLVTWAPVTLYRDREGVVRFADISLPGRNAKFITPTGTPLLDTPLDMVLTYRAERTTFARWAIGPLPHIDLSMSAAPTPDEDRDIQYLRHLNASMRELMDSALSPSEWAPEANSVVDDGLVDFRIRGVIKRREYRQLVSKQTGEASGVILSDGYHEIAPEVTAAPTTEAALDALLEAE